MQRREAMGKLSGRELYVDDLPAADAWWGFTVRSPVARGLLREIRFPSGFDRSQFVVVTAEDVPGPNVVKLLEADQPVLASTEVRHIHEPVALVAHPHRDTARRCREAFEVMVTSLPAVFDPWCSPADSQVQHGEDNVFKRIVIDQGDARSALKTAPVVIEGTYETGAQEHVYIENQGMLASLEGDVLVIRGSMQCPYYVLAALTHALNRPAEKVRVVQAATGGGFGGKEEFPSHLALHAALLTLKSGHPVKMIYDRDEDMAATPKRHPARVTIRTGVTEDGQLLAQEMNVTLDGGAYVTLSPVVLSRGVLHAAGPYRCDHTRIEGVVRLTNAVPFGAFRGFGAPQAIFATERHWDVIANRLGLDPVELRRRNLLVDGDTMATGQVVEDGVDRHAVVERALELSQYGKRQSSHRQFNREHSYLRRGIGLATFYHGAGFTGSGEVYLDSLVGLAARADGSVEIRTANVEMGQGTLTIFTKIVSEGLGYDPIDVHIAPVDTSRVPNSGPTVASRTVMVVGGLLARACAQLREGRSNLTGASLKQALMAEIAQGSGDEIEVTVRYQPPPGVPWDEATYRGSAYGAYAWACYVADVEVDLRTGGVTVVDFVAVQDVGTVLDDGLARGQIQGGVVQGIGWALLENCQFADGAMVNANLTNYTIPTSVDAPPIRVEFLETPYALGPGGAKGLGELPMDGPAPAIANAIAAATGVHVRQVPCLPEVLLEQVLA